MSYGLKKLYLGIYVCISTHTDVITINEKRGQEI